MKYSKKRRTKNKEWISINGTVKYQGEISEDVSYLLHPWNLNKNIKPTAKVMKLLPKRPIINGHKTSRHMKDIVYLEIQKHLKHYNVNGAYVGLAAAYSPEIFVLFKEYIKNRFVNCQLYRKDFKALLKYQPFIAEAYPKKKHKTEFELYKTDIIEYLFTQRGKFSIYDLDFMCTLTEEKINTIIAGITYSVQLPATVALWHTSGRNITNEEIDYSLRPYLLNSLSNIFNVIDHTHIDYFEGYPMRTEIITIDKKVA